MCAPALAAGEIARISNVGSYETPAGNRTCSAERRSRIVSPTGVSLLQSVKTGRAEVQQGPIPGNVFLGAFRGGSPSSLCWASITVGSYLRDGFEFRPL